MVSNVFRYVIDLYMKQLACSHLHEAVCMPKKKNSPKQDDMLHIPIKKKRKPRQDFELKMPFSQFTVNSYLLFF